MNHHKPLFISFLILVLFLSGCGKNPSMITIETDHESYSIEVEMALTDEEKSRGLMGRDRLPEGKGMLFYNENGSKTAFWMKDMKIPLDIIFIGEDLGINHIEERVAPCIEPDDSQCQRYSSNQKTIWILEVPSGYAEKNGVQIGNQISLSL